jgi:hypothetical protein
MPITSAQFSAKEPDPEPEVPDEDDNEEAA